MKFRTLLWAVAFSCLPVANLLAEVNVGDHPQLQFQNAFGNKPVDLRSLSGKIIVVDFWASWCGPCMQEAPHIVAINQKYAAQGLQMIGISLDSDRAAMEGIVKDKGFNWPQYFDGQAWDSPIAKAWGVESIPQTFLISPQGEVLWRGHPALVDPELEKAMKEHPPVLVDPQTLALANQTLDKVEAATGASKYAEAIRLLGRFPADAKADPKIAARVADDTKRLEAAAESVLDHAEALVAAKKYTEAVAQLKGLVASMEGTNEGKKAQESLNKLRADPAAASAIAAAAREDSAGVALQTAQKLQAAKRDHPAYIALKALVKQYPGTVAAATAGDAIKTYDADPAFARQQADAEAADRSARARGELSMALNYLHAGRTETARAKFQNVVDHYPGTAEADAAKDELAKLTG